MAVGRWTLATPKSGGLGAVRPRLFVVADKDQPLDALERIMLEGALATLEHWLSGDVWLVAIRRPDGDLVMLEPHETQPVSARILAKLDMLREQLLEL